jgi:hypothetical protein
MGYWPLIALAIRMAAWLIVPAGRFASDEQSYFDAATALMAGRPDLFWPPLTTWLIALPRVLLGNLELPILRLGWIAMDLLCLLAVGVLARRVAVDTAQAAKPTVERVVALSMMGYALYLPAISHAQFLTSETPALLQVLCVLVLVTAPSPSPAAVAGAGLLAGTLVLTRPSLLPLLVLWPAALAGRDRSRRTIKRAALFVATGAVVIGGYASLNAVTAGQFTISTNSSYNLYIGNRDLYAEDLNLIRPRATPEQIEFRRQQFRGTVEYPTQSPAELERAAVEWITAHPLTFLRRAAGRLARVFVPKTDVLELVGGEAAAGVFSFAPLTLLAIANAQWFVILTAGLIGLAALRHTRPVAGRLFLFTIIGSVLLCLVAISKPRYSFVFDPLLIVAAATLAVSPSQARVVPRHDWWGLAGVFAFLFWGWVAWLIFAFSSRSAL